MLMMQTQTKFLDSRSSGKIIFIPANMIDEVWDEASKLLQMALDAAFCKEDIDDIRRQIVEKKYGLYVFFTHVLETACVCDVLSVKKGDIFRILYTASVKGSDINWEIALEDFSRFAKSLGCIRIEITGRKGWERKFKNLGFSFDCLTIARDLRCPKVEVDSQQQQPRRPNHGMSKSHI